MCLFILIDALSPTFKACYTNTLEKIHTNLLRKLHPFGDVLKIDAADYPDASSFYKSLPSLSKGRDVLILDAHAGALCPTDLKEFLAYQQKGRYEVLFAETLPEGLLPALISSDFLEDLAHFIPQGASLGSSFKSLVNWEYKGVDLGIWLSPSRIILERAAFIPEDRGSLLFLNECSSLDNLSITQLEGMVKTQPFFPRYFAVELMGSDGQPMDRELFKGLMAQADTLAPEAVLSLGIHNEVFNCPNLLDILALVSPNRKVLIESPSQLLDEALVLKVLARPNTEIIFNYTPALKNFLGKFSQNTHLWARLLRNKSTEELIRPFLNDFAFLGERAIIAKADSFGDPSQRSVDLAPINRHACYALGREMLFNSQGGLMVCRQAPSHLQGSLAQNNLEQLWALRRQAYVKQCAQPSEALCPLCPACDDWWIFNF